MHWSKRVLAILLLLAFLPTGAYAATALGEGTCIEKSTGATFDCSAEIVFTTEQNGVADSKAFGEFSLFIGNTLYVSRPVFWFEEFEGACAEFCFVATTDLIGQIIAFSYVQANLLPGIGGLHGGFATDGSVNSWIFDDFGDPIHASGTWTPVIVSGVPLPAAFPLLAAALGVIGWVGRARRVA